MLVQTCPRFVGTNSRTDHQMSHGYQDSNTNGFRAKEDGTNNISLVVPIIMAGHTDSKNINSDTQEIKKQKDDSEEYQLKIHNTVINSDSVQIESDLVEAETFRMFVETTVTESFKHHSTDLEDDAVKQVVLTSETNIANLSPHSRGPNDGVCDISFNLNPPSSSQSTGDIFSKNFQETLNFDNHSASDSILPITGNTTDSKTEDTKSLDKTLHVHKKNHQRVTFNDKNLVASQDTSGKGRATHTNLEMKKTEPVLVKYGVKEALNMATNSLNKNQKLSSQNRQDEDCDNPFQPEGEVSQDADLILKLWKHGREMSQESLLNSAERAVTQGFREENNKNKAEKEEKHVSSIGAGYQITTIDKHTRNINIVSPDIVNRDDINIGKKLLPNVLDIDNTIKQSGHGIGYNNGSRCVDTFKILVQHENRGNNGQQKENFHISSPDSARKDELFETSKKLLTNGLYINNTIKDSGNENGYNNIIKHVDNFDIDSYDQNKTSNEEFNINKTNIINEDDTKYRSNTKDINTTNKKENGVGVNNNKCKTGDSVLNSDSMEVTNGGLHYNGDKTNGGMELNKGTGTNHNMKQTNGKTNEIALIEEKHKYKNKLKKNCEMM